VHSRLWSWQLRAFVLRNPSFSAEYCIQSSTFLDSYHLQHVKTKRIILLLIVMAATAILVGSFRPAATSASTFVAAHALRKHAAYSTAATLSMLRSHKPSLTSLNSRLPRRAMAPLQGGYLSSVPDDYFNRPGPWDEEDLGSLLDANKRWATRMRERNPEFFEDLKCHAPKILWIGCADARVPANEIIGEPPGSVFIHRNIANMVVNTDFNCMSCIQYAVDVLKVKHIIICGHYDCGGIRAALTLRDHKAPLENWLRNIKDSYRIHRHELNAIEDPIMRQRRMVEINVVEQVCVGA
jgi:carbonic anhydrase